ncbi:MAG TPA: squalene synthase HpnC [Vicinamibacterales bacterium]
MPRPDAVPIRALPPDLAAAYRHCERIARSHYENFPVASWLLPARMRPHVAAVYAFARTADDFADEGDRPAAERYRLLDNWQARLNAAVSGRIEDDEHGPVFRAVAHTIAACELPVSLFEDLLSAFRQDVDTHRYVSWTGLLDYCRRSANPVGRLVLGIAGHRGADVEQASDYLCTALQLANFWQDFRIDWERGRLYVPMEVSGRLRAQEADLVRGELTTPWREALREMVRRTRALFDAGRPVADLVDGRLRFELRLTWLGGRRILDRLEASGYDPWTQRPKLRGRDVPSLAWDALRWDAD